MVLVLDADNTHSVELHTRHAEKGCANPWIDDYVALKWLVVFAKMTGIRNQSPPLKETDWCEGGGAIPLICVDALQMHYKVIQS